MAGVFEEGIVEDADSNEVFSFEFAVVTSGLDMLLWNLINRRDLMNR